MLIVRPSDFGTDTRTTIIVPFESGRSPKLPRIEYFGALALERDRPRGEDAARGPLGLAAHEDLRARRDAAQLEELDPRALRGLLEAQAELRRDRRERRVAAVAVLVDAVAGDVGAARADRRVEVVAVGAGERAVAVAVALARVERERGRGEAEQHLRLAVRGGERVGEIVVDLVGAVAADDVLGDAVERGDRVVARPGVEGVGIRCRRRAGRCRGRP